MASEFVGAIPANSVTLLDKGFFSADLLLGIQNGESNRHWMIPERKGLVSTELERYGDGDCLVQMRVSPQARKKGRGRNGSRLPPPAQIRTCGITAYGSCLGF